MSVGTAGSTASKLVLWIGYGSLAMAASRTLPLLVLVALPLAVIIVRLRQEDRAYLIATYVRRVLVFTLFLFGGIALVTAAGDPPATMDAALRVGGIALLKSGRFMIVLIALCLILSTTTATTFYRELQALGVPPHWRATLLPAALYPKTLLVRLGVIREAQLARGIDPRAGFIQRPRIFLTTITLLLLGTLSNIPDRAAILSTRGVYLRDRGPRLRREVTVRDALLAAGGAACFIAALLIWVGVLTP